MKRFVTGVEILACLATLVFVVMLFANEPGGGGSAASDSPGATVYSSSCASCHGADGQGGTGPALADVTSAFPDVEDEIAVVTDGRSNMPSFGDRLSEEEISQVVEYTRTELGG